MPLLFEVALFVWQLGGRIWALVGFYGFALVWVVRSVMFFPVEESLIVF